eukprot:6731830-Prymnesium_polylepis.1
MHLNVGCLEALGVWKLPRHWDGGILELRAVCTVLVTQGLVVDPSHLRMAPPKLASLDSNWQS